MTAAIRRVGAAVFLVLMLCLSGGAMSVAQTTDAAAVELAPSSLDYIAWAAMAERAEAAIADRASLAPPLEQIRAQLVDWRAAFLVAQSADSARIGSLRSQIAALGPAPTDNTIEAAEIADRRTELSDQLVRLQAPGIAADEAYSRADGLIREIDLRLREQKAAELLRLWPAPINPANWPAAMRAVSAVAVGLWHETTENWHNEDARKQLGDNLPLTAVLLVLAVGLLWRGRAWAAGIAGRIQTKAAARRRKIASAPMRGRRIWMLLATLAQVILSLIHI